MIKVYHTPPFKKQLDYILYNSKAPSFQSTERFPLCSYLRSITERNPNIVFAVYRDEVDQARPESFVEFRQYPLLFQLLDKNIHLLVPGLAMVDFIRHGIALLLGRLIPPSQVIVAFLLIILVHSDTGVLGDELLCHPGQNVHVLAEPVLLFGHITRIAETLL